MISSSIYFLGEVLSKEINKPALVCSGLIRLSLKEEFDPPPISYQYKHYKQAIKNTLSKKLHKLGVANVDDVISNLIEKLKENQFMVSLTNI